MIYLTFKLLKNDKPSGHYGRLDLDETYESAFLRLCRENGWDRDDWGFERESSDSGSSRIERISAHDTPESTGYSDGWQINIFYWRRNALPGDVVPDGNGRVRTIDCVRCGSDGRTNVVYRW